MTFLYYSIHNVMLQDATPILRSTCIKSISDSEIHVSLDNMAVYYEDNVSSDYDVSRFSSSN